MRWTSFILVVHTRHTPLQLMQSQSSLLGKGTFFPLPRCKPLLPKWVYWINKFAGAGSSGPGMQIKPGGQNISGAVGSDTPPSRPQHISTLPCFSPSSLYYYHPCPHPCAHLPAPFQRTAAFRMWWIEEMKSNKYSVHGTETFGGLLLRELLYQGCYYSRVKARASFKPM